MIRGEVKPDRGNSQVFVDNISVAKNRDAARVHLGVCSQHDPLDQMTVLEHLRFYAGIRGLKDIEHNVANLVGHSGTGWQASYQAAISGSLDLPSHSSATQMSSYSTNPPQEWVPSPNEACGIPSRDLFLIARSSSPHIQWKKQMP